MNTYRLKITPLTPLCIGAGEALQPYEYVVLDSTLHVFEPYDMVVKLDTAEQAEAAGHLQNFPGKLHRLLQKKPSLVIAISRVVVPVSPDTIKIYDERLNNSSSDLSLYTFIRTGDSPYLPGSSLKGSIRTALLYSRVLADKIDPRSRDVEKQAFKYNRVDEDPFKYLRVSDSLPLPGSTIMAVVNLCTKGSSGQWVTSLPMFREVTGAKLWEPGYPVFTHTLDISPSSRQFNMQNIASACRQFYGKHLENEMGFCAGLPGASSFTKKVKEQLGNLADLSFPVRLGWGSGFDSVTVNLACGQPEEKRSRRLVAGKLPLGWALVEATAC